MNPVYMYWNPKITADGYLVQKRNRIGRRPYPEKEVVQKTRFLNPIIQNKVHLKWLKEFLQEDSIAFHSYIVFSDRCTLKDIHLTS